MKKLCTTITLILFVFIATSLQAQMELPQPSPSAKVMQTVGLTEITVEYSSPGVKGREGKIWGGLEKYGEIWRMGANGSTKITFSRDVKVNGKELKAGTYSLGAIPKKDEDWTLIFSNTKELGGWGNYDEANDALRINVKPQESDFDERLRFSVTDFDNKKGKVNMDWEKIHVSFDIEVNTDESAWNSIQATLNPGWREYASAARYASDERKDYETALDWINKSIESKEGWYNTWLKAEIYAKMKNNKEAKKSAQKAMELGLAAEEDGQNFFYKSRVEKALKEW